MIDKKNHSDNLLVAQFKEGNQRAFQVLFEKYWEVMFIKANAILGNRAAVEDIIQEVWINLWKLREKRDIADFQAYLFQSVRYGCYKYLRDNKFNNVQIKVINSLPLISEAEIEGQHNLVHVQTIIDKSLKELTPRCQQIFRLSRMEHTTNEEIAIKFGISKRSVENQVSLALKVIRRHMATLHAILLYLFV
ncbi:RNA polymerase sigma factor [Zobellia alginiliquefaciens]|uniref:RNA polymerase sigma factor n=1 Tax=Zobellia alginiliquefaciens TaxID=3032586 RepID=UPI0023E3DBD2|nr:sigma-70 family RNA polymerase sigma factor [Zobellia alginiliquefaciens]